jgi:hypothetical protein
MWRQNYSSKLGDEEPILELLTPNLEFGSEWNQKWIRGLRFEINDTAEGVTVEYAANYSDTFHALFSQAAFSSKAKWDGTIKWDGRTMWTTSGNYMIALSPTVHCRVIRFRIRGKNLEIRSMGLGFYNEGV